MDNHATTNRDPSHELPERRRSARDLVLAGVAVGGDKQFAVDELQLVYREPAVAVAPQGDVLDHRQGDVALSSTPQALVIRVEAGETETANYEDVVAGHLERFGERDELHMVWERAGHTPGG
jgi:Uncharacterized protein conserved in bacteria (DUF2218)